MSLYWPSAYGLTVVDHLVKDVNFEDEWIEWNNDLDLIIINLNSL
jgi:hypothetical protein